MPETDAASQSGPCSSIYRLGATAGWNGNRVKGGKGKIEQIFFFNSATASSEDDYRPVHLIHRFHELDYRHYSNREILSDGVVKIYCFSVFVVVSHTHT